MKQTNFSLTEIKQASDALGFATIAAMAVDLNIAYTAVIQYSEGHDIRQPEQVRLEETINYGLKKSQEIVK